MALDNDDPDHGAGIIQLPLPSVPKKLPIDQSVLDEMLGDLKGQPAEAPRRNQPGWFKHGLGYVLFLGLATLSVWSHFQQLNIAEQTRFNPSGLNYDALVEWQLQQVRKMSHFSYLSTAPGLVALITAVFLASKSRRLKQFFGYRSDLA